MICDNKLKVSCSSKDFEAKSAIENFDEIHFELPDAFSLMRNIERLL